MLLGIKYTSELNSQHLIMRELEFIFVTFMHHWPFYYIFPSL